MTGDMAQGPRGHAGRESHVEQDEGSPRVAYLSCSCLVALFALCYAAHALPTNSQAEVEDNSTLRLVFALWRHGDRAPVQSYATDPYKDSEYLPEGLGNLNVAGKKRAHDLGLYIRSRYDAFLGPELLPDVAVLRSTIVQRAIESGQLVMAGAFPPAQDQTWDTGLGQLWEPVAFTTQTEDRDSLLYGFLSDCTSMYTDQILASKMIGAEALSLLVGNMSEVIRTNAGIDPTDLKQLAILGDTLIAQDSCGLELPAWTSQVYPEPLRTFLGMLEGTYVYTKRQKKLAGGIFLNEMVTESLKYQANTLPARRKFYAFSAHDLTIISILAPLGVWDGLLPGFSSAVFIELHEKGENKTLGFQVYYRNDTSGSGSEPLSLPLPGCGEFCPLDQFQKVYEHMILTDEQRQVVCTEGD